MSTKEKGCCSWTSKPSLERSKRSSAPRAAMKDSESSAKTSSPPSARTRKRSSPKSSSPLSRKMSPASTPHSPSSSPTKRKASSATKKLQTSQRRPKRSKLPATRFASAPRARQAKPCSKMRAFCSSKTRNQTDCQSRMQKKLHPAFPASRSANACQWDGFFIKYEVSEASLQRSGT